MSATQLEYITGALYMAGDIELAESSYPVPGVVVSIARDVLRSAPTLPMYRQVAIVPAEDLAQLRDLRVAYEQNSQQCVQLNRALKRATDAMGSEFARSDFELAAAAKRESELRSDLNRVADELKAAKDWILNDSKTIGELRSDLASLRVSYEQNAHQCVELNRDLARVTEERDGARDELTKYASDHRKICHSQEGAITALRARVAELVAALPEMIAMAEAWQSTDGEPATEFVRRLKALTRAESATPDHIPDATKMVSATPAKHPDTVRLDWLEWAPSERLAEVRRILWQQRDTCTAVRAAIDAAHKQGWSHD